MLVRRLCPPEFLDLRAAMARLVVDLPWVESFSYRFRYPQHVNLLELEVLISLIRGFVDRGFVNRRVLCLVDSQVVLGSVCKGRSSSRRANFRPPSTRWSFCYQTICRSTCVGYPLGQILATHHRVFYSVSKWRTVLPLFSRQLHVTPEALPEAQVEVDRCSSHLARAPEPVCNACEKNMESRLTLTLKAVSQQRRPRLRFKMRPCVDTATPSKEADNKCEWVDVVKNTYANKEKRISCVTDRCS